MAGQSPLNTSPWLENRLSRGNWHLESGRADMSRHCATGRAGSRIRLAEVLVLKMIPLENHPPEGRRNNYEILPLVFCSGFLPFVFDT